jgi:hypothetical protein
MKKKLGVLKVCAAKKEHFETSPPFVVNAEILSEDTKSTLKKLKNAKEK